MKPGDMIEWVHKFSGHLVHEDETLWSSTEERFVPIGSEMFHFLVSINDETFSWLNEKGLFHACVGDTDPSVFFSRPGPVVPRVCG